MPEGRAPKKTEFQQQVHGRLTSADRRGRLSGNAFDSAIPKVNGAMTNRRRLRAVRDKKQRRSRFVSEFPKQLQNGGAVDRIEITRWFVRQNQRRPMGQRSRNSDPLLLSTGHLVGKRVAARSEPHPLEQRSDTRHAFRPRQSGELQRQLDVFEDRQCREQMEKLKNRTDLRAPEVRQVVSRKVVQLPTQKNDFTAIGSIDPAKAIEQRGFATSGWTHQGNPLALTYAQRDIDQNWLVGIMTSKRMGLNHVGKRHACTMREAG